MQHALLRAALRDATGDVAPVPGWCVPIERKMMRAVRRQLGRVDKYMLFTLQTVAVGELRQLGAGLQDLVEQELTAPSEGGAAQVVAKHGLNSLRQCRAPWE